MPSNHLVLCCPLFLLLSIFLSIRVFSSELVLHIRWPKYWSFSFSITPCSEYSGLISFSIDWFDLHAVQGTLKSVLQHHSMKASILYRSVFFMVQLLHPHMTTRKTIALTIQTFVGKIISLLFNMISRFVLIFLPGSKCLNFMATVIISSDFGAQESKVCHCFHCFPPIHHEVMGLDALIFVFWMLSFKQAFINQPVFSSVTSDLFLQTEYIKFWHFQMSLFILFLSFCLCLKSRLSTRLGVWDRLGILVEMLWHYANNFEGVRKLLIL